MAAHEKQAADLAWAGRKIAKAQQDGAYCTIVVHVKGGEIIKAERNESFVPPSPGARVRETGS